MTHQLLVASLGDFLPTMHCNTVPLRESSLRTVRGRWHILRARLHKLQYVRYGVALTGSPQIACLGVARSSSSRRVHAVRRSGFFSTPLRGCGLLSLLAGHVPPSGTEPDSRTSII
jgi:hypothetical protein